MEKLFADAIKRPAGLSRRDAATYLGCSTRYLDKLATAGEIQRAKFGAKTVFRLIDLDAYLESRLQPRRPTNR